MLQNKIILITGGSGLLGRHFIKDAILNGAIVINCDIKENRVANEEFQYLDITNEESIDNALEAILGKYGRIDGIVNNAYPRTSDWGASFEDVTYDSWCSNVNMQLNSNFLIIQKVIAQSIEREVPVSIVNIASIYGIVGNDPSIYEGTNMTSAPAYSAIKGGLINFTRYLAAYYGKFNIRVNSVSPGGVYDNQNPVFVKAYNERVPMRRMAKAFEIAPAVSFLLSDKASYVNGHNLVVDGGWTAI